VQLLNHLSKNAADNHLAIKSIEQSNVWDGLKKKIIAPADRDTKAMSDEIQVSLFKMGRYKENGWNHLREAIKEHDDLWSPAKLRQVFPA
jgi:hypothetical protein